MPAYRPECIDTKPALILPEVVDESKWRRGRHMFLDDKDQYIFAFNGAVRSWFAYNTKLVNPHEIRSYWDLLSPKWKGRIVGLDPTSSGAGSPLRFLYYHPELGPKFVSRLLTETDITVSRDMRQNPDWLGTGKFALSVLTAVSRTGFDEAKKQGLPIDWFGPKSFREGAAVNSAGGNVGLLNRAPHPNAAKVAVNWLVSREAQIAYQKIGAEADSLRIDIPKDDVPSYSRRLGGVKYIVLDERMDIQPIRKFIAEVWKRN
jgi:iron(III) transport system substrate-binding protein